MHVCDFSMMNRDAMEQIYKDSSKRIYDFLYKFTNNSDTALDLLQETFLSFFKQYQERDLEKDNIMKILYTIARNQSINLAKKASTRRESHSEIDASDKTVSFTKKLELKEMEEQLMNCLQELPPDQRSALIMKNLDDLNLTQIAGIMDVSVSTVSRLVVKGTSSLLQIASKRGIRL